MAELPLEISKNIFSVGSRDWNRRMFDALIPLPKGTSYNSYLIKGKKKNALIDTVNPGFENELLGKIESLIGLKNLHYLIMNHAEPDHASAIPFIVEKTPAIVLCSEKGSKFVTDYYNVPKERVKVVKEGDKIELGDKTLTFIDAPFLHWPETMFSYLVEDKILFPCDFFGSHTAFGTYDTDAEDLITHAKKYFAEIMMPYKQFGKKAMDKLKNYKIKMIAPSHGPIYQNPELILKEYAKWTNGETKNKALIVYATMWGSTKQMVNQITNTLISEGIEVAQYDLANSDIGEIAKDMVDAKAVVLGSPTVLANLHPGAIYALTLLKALRAPTRYAAFLGSYGWGAAGARNTVGMLDGTGIEVVGAVEIFGKPGNEDFAKVEELGKKLALKIKG